MKNMVDFAKKMKEKWDSYSPEEKEYFEKRENLEKENTFYETATVLESVWGRKACDVCLYRLVRQDLTVSSKLTLSFGGSPWEYTFDKTFLDIMLARLKNSNLGLCVDVGNEIYVLPEEMRRILSECRISLEKKGVSLV